MKRVAWSVGGLLGVAALVFGVRALLEPSLGPIEATPTDASLSLLVGDSLTFEAGADGALTYSWSVWDQEVSREPTWVFGPGPEEVGWQQVTLVVTGRGDARRERSWNVGVAIPVAPELTETAPEPGALSAEAGRPVSFRCGARVPAARDIDRVRFEWTLDGVPIQRDELPASGAESQLTFRPAAGVHKVAVHVREVDRIASFAEWTLDVASAPVEVARADAAPPPIPAEPPKVDAAAPDDVETAAPSPTVPEPARVEPEPEPELDLESEADVEPDDEADEDDDEEVDNERTPEPPPAASPPVVAKASPPSTVQVEPAPVAPAPPAAAASPSTTVPMVVARATPPEPPAAPPARLVREPKRGELAVATGTGVILQARVEPESGPMRYRWTVDGRVVREGREGRFDYLPIEPGRHQVGVTVHAGEREVGTGGWVVVARTPVEPAPPPPPPVASATPPPTVPPPPVPAAPPAVAARGQAELDEPPARQLREDEVRRWLQDYAAAWSRKDVEALRRMGQVRSGGEVERLERYFKSIDDLRVEVRVLAVRVDGERAAVEFERTDTMTDPAGQRRELRLPPFRKQIERTPDGLRFAAGAG